MAFNINRFINMALLYFCILSASCGDRKEALSQNSQNSQNSHIASSNDYRFLTQLTSKQKKIFDQLTLWGNPTPRAEDIGNYREVDYGYFTGDFNCTLKSSSWIRNVLDGDYVISSNDPNDDNWRQYEFKTDTKLPKNCRSYSTDYTNSGYDRGHLAPAKDFQGYGDEAVEDSFLTSNISPQVGAGFNRHLWYALEKATRSWAKTIGQIAIFTGPVYMSESDINTSEGDDDSKTKQIGLNGRIRVPDAFYKIIIDMSDLDAPKALSFMMKNIDHRLVEYPDSKLNPKCEDNVKSPSNPSAKYCARDNVTNIARHQISIKELERLTGLKFFPNMPEDLASILKKPTTTVWEYDAAVNFL